MTAAEQLRATRIADLQTKLSQRQDKPGFAANVAAIRRQIADLEAEVVFRDVESKQFVSVAHAIQNPETTERVETEA